MDIQKMRGMFEQILSDIDDIEIHDKIEYGLEQNNVLKLKNEDLSLELLKIVSHMNDIDKRLEKLTEEVNPLILKSYKKTFKK